MLGSQIEKTKSKSLMVDFFLKSPWYSSNRIKCMAAENTEHKNAHVACCKGDPSHRRKINILQKMSFKQLSEVLLWLYTYVVTTKQLLCCEALLCVCTQLNTDRGSASKQGRHPHRLTLFESLPQNERIVLDIVFSEDWEKRKTHGEKTNS